MNSRNPLRDKLKALFSKHMKETRDNVGDSQEAMAAKLDISARSYFDLDKGKSLCSTFVLVRYLVLLYKAGKVLPFLQSLSEVVDEVDRSNSLN